MPDIIAPEDFDEILSTAEALKSSAVPDRAQDQRLQELFDLCIDLDRKHFPDHLRTAIILIKWAQRLDDLNLSGEIEELSNVWRNEYGYPIELLELDDQEPQKQIVDTLAKFTKKASEDNIRTVVVYYGGHGGAGPLGQLILA